VGVLVVSCDFMSGHSCRADPIVKVGKETVEEVTGKNVGGEIAYHFQNPFHSELCNS
jgi:hypothetical protein